MGTRSILRPVLLPVTRAVSDTIRGFKGIVAGEYDHLPEPAFYMVGTIEEVVAKAAKLAEAA